MTSAEELVATVRWERSAFENDDGTRTAILDAKNANGEDIVLRGQCREGEIKTGLAYRFFGRWRRHPRYGPQFAFTSFALEEPSDELAIRTYLQQCRGVGPATALRLWMKYQHDAVRMLREHPEEASEGIPRFTAAMAREAAETLKAIQATERTKIELMALLKGRGFPKATANWAIERWGVKAPEIIRRNPYKLMAFRGCGFLLCDRMWLDLGLPPNRLKRQGLCAWYAVASDTEGHTWLPERAVKSIVAQKTAGADLQIERAIELARRARLIAVRTDGEGMKWIADGRKAKDEAWLAQFVRAAKWETPQWPDPDRIDGISEHQREALRQAFGGTIGILVGSPGTGKTVCAAALLRTLVEMGYSSQIAAAAPTGKAAVRLTEFLFERGIHLQATTIHGLLRVVNRDEGGWEFEHNAANPLPYQWIVLDEMSMADTTLMGYVLGARKRGAHVLLIGDTNQLAPVGHGAPLRDLIAAGLPCGELREIHRNAGRIVRACAEIRDNRTLTCRSRFNLEACENLILVDTRKPEEQLAIMEQMLDSIAAKGFDPIWDCQVICAVNEKSSLSRKALNARLQAKLNTRNATQKQHPFRIGDKVICLKNGLLPEVSLDSQDNRVFVANGEQGEVVGIEPLRTIVRLESPPRIVVIPHRENPSAESDDKSGIGDWNLAYAITGHKAQGAQWPFVIVLVDSFPGASMVTTRNWLYTAISRAQKACALIGSKPLVAQICKQDGLQRKTFLRELLVGGEP